MPKKDESKHDAFRRLKEKRLNALHEQLRLIAQLASKNYEHTPEEAEALVAEIDSAVQKVAQAYGVPYSSVIGEADRRVPAAVVASAMAMIEAGEPAEAEALLEAALRDLDRSGPA